ncbi:MAG TPA: hypothetical protein VNU23_01300 [Candidatus Cybelea sp.]|jgi:hypothetical protein|nr:hypothetical protein [Candidatus Cybelea sp.]
MSPGPPTFPVLRWFGLVWMVVWLPAYFRVWGWANLLHLCDVAVILTFVGIWLANPLLLSSQAVGSLAPGFFWILDVGWRLTTGRFLVGGTDYMWDPRYPLWVRLLSTFHVGLPLVLLWTLPKIGYDRRALGLEAAIAAVLLIISRFLSAGLNMNYAYRDPLFHRAWGPAPAHLAMIFIPLVALIYWPAHLLLSWLFRAPGGSP